MGKSVPEMEIHWNCSNSGGFDAGVWSLEESGGWAELAHCRYKITTRPKSIKWPSTSQGRRVDKVRRSPKRHLLRCSLAGTIHEEVTGQEGVS